METTMDFIERLRASNDGCSNYRIAKILDTSQSAVVKYTKHGGTMDDRIAVRMAEALGIDPAYVLACMAAERANTFELSKQWERIAAHFAASALFAVPLMSLIHWRF